MEYNMNNMNNMNNVSNVSDMNESFIIEDSDHLKNEL